MGSMESLSSHSSEQNSCSKTGSPSRSKHKGSGSLCWTTSSPSSNGPKSPPCTASPDSSSKEDANKTDGEWEEALSTSPGDRSSPASEILQRTLGETLEDHGEEQHSLSTCSSLTSLHISEGKKAAFLHDVEAKSRNPASYPLTTHNPPFNRTLTACANKHQHQQNAVNFTCKIISGQLALKMKQALRELRGLVLK